MFVRLHEYESNAPLFVNTDNVLYCKSTCQWEWENGWQTKRVPVTMVHLVSGKTVLVTEPVDDILYRIQNSKP